MDSLCYGLLYPFDLGFDSSQSEWGHGTAAQPDEVKPPAPQLDAPFVYQDCLPVQGRQNELFLRYPTMQDDSQYFGPIHQATMRLLQVLCQEERQAPGDRPASGQPTTPVSFRSAPPQPLLKPASQHRRMGSEYYPAPSTTADITAGWAKPEKTAEDDTSTTSLSNQPRRQKAASRRWRNVYVRLERVIYRMDDEGADFNWDRRCSRWANEEGTPWDKDDLACYVLSGIPVFAVVVRPRGDGFPVELSWDEETNTFQGVDAMCGKTMQVGDAELGSLLEDPNQSVVIT